jgi:hypothetical protein
VRLALSGERVPEMRWLALLQLWSIGKSFFRVKTLSSGADTDERSHCRAL